MKRFNSFSLFIVTLLVSFNCAPITSDMQSAKSIGKGGIEVTLNTGSLDYDDSDENSMSDVQDNFGAHIAYGVGDKIDVRGRFENIKVNGLNSIDESGEGVDITLFSMGIKYGIFKSVSTRIELPDGSKQYAKTINNEPSKFFTKEILNKVDKAAKREFLYGQE